MQGTCVQEVFHNTTVTVRGPFCAYLQYLGDWHVESKPCALCCVKRVDAAAVAVFCPI